MRFNRNTSWSLVYKLRNASKWFSVGIPYESELGKVNYPESDGGILQGAESTALHPLYWGRERGDQPHPLQLIGHLSVERHMQKSHTFMPMNYRLKGGWKCRFGPTHKHGARSTNGPTPRTSSIDDWGDASWRALLKRSSVHSDLRLTAFTHRQHGEEITHDAWILWRWDSGGSHTAQCMGAHSCSRRGAHLYQSFSGPVARGDEWRCSSTCPGAWLWECKEGK